MDPSTFEGDVQCRISIEEENFSYNFKHKGPNNYQFKNVGENMSVKIEIFDANERIERVVDLVNIIAKKESYNTTFNLQNINKQYRGSFLLRFDVIKQEQNTWKSDVNLIKSKVNKQKKYSGLVDENNKVALGENQDDAEEGEDGEVTKKPLNVWMKSQVEKEKRKAELQEKIASVKGIGHEYLRNVKNIFF